MQCDTTARNVALVVGRGPGFGVGRGGWDCARAFLQALLLEKTDVWITPHPEAEVRHGRAWRLLKTMPGLKGGAAAWCYHATKVKEELCGLIQSARDPCVHSNVRKRCGPCVTWTTTWMWALRPR